jgi:hypothetical protein
MSKSVTILGLARERIFMDPVEGVNKRKIEDICKLIKCDAEAICTGDPHKSGPDHYETDK